MEDNKKSNILGVDLGEEKKEEVKSEPVVGVKVDKYSVSGPDEKKNVELEEDNIVYIKDLAELRIEVREIMNERKSNPSAVQEDDLGVVFKEGEPFMIIHDKYVPHAEAQLIIQKRKVVMEILKLEDLKIKLNK